MFRFFVIALFVILYGHNDLNASYEYTPFDIVKYDDYDGVYFAIPATRAQCHITGQVNNSYSLDVNIICEDKNIKKSLNWTKLKNKKIYVIFSRSDDNLYIAIYPIVKMILVQYKNENTGVYYSKKFSHLDEPLEYNSLIAMAMGF